MRPKYRNQNNQHQMSKKLYPITFSSKGNGIWYISQNVYFVYGHFEFMACCQGMIDGNFLGIIEGTLSYHETKITCVAIFFGVQNWNYSTIKMFRTIYCVGIEIDPGVHTYLFAYRLPDLLPSSYNSPYGQISYHLQVHLQTSDTTQDLRSHFFVRASVNINLFKSSQVS